MDEELLPFDHPISKLRLLIQLVGPHVDDVDDAINLATAIGHLLHPNELDDVFTSLIKKFLKIGRKQFGLKVLKATWSSALATAKDSPTQLDRFRDALMVYKNKSDADIRAKIGDEPEYDEYDSELQYVAEGDWDDEAGQPYSYGEHCEEYEEWRDSFNRYSNRINTFCDATYLKLFNVRRICAGQPTVNIAVNGTMGDAQTFVSNFKNSSDTSLTLPPVLSNRMRFQIHGTAQEQGLYTKSTGPQGARMLKISKTPIE